MIEARFFIGDLEVNHVFNEDQINETINELSMIHLEKLGHLPLAIYLSPDLYKAIMMQTRVRTPMADTPGANIMHFWTANGSVMVKPVFEPKERFIYAGTEQGYQDALINKRFEELVLGIEE